MALTSAAPNVFTVGLADDASLANMQGVIDSAYRPLATTTGLPQAIPGRATYLARAAGHFDAPTLSNETLEETVWGPHADPDHDGLANVIEQITLSDPRLPTPTPLALVPAPGGGHSIRFRARRDLPSLRVTLETSDTFAAWLPLLAPWQATGFPNEWSVPFTGNFARLAVSLDE